MISKTIHQIWIGPDEMSEDCRDLCREMKNIHEALGYTYKLWGNELWDLYIDDEFIQTWRENIDDYHYCFVVDRLRLLLLRDIGGIAMDVDCKCIKPMDVILDKLHDNITYFAGLRRSIGPGALIEPTVVGSTKNSRMVQRLLELYDDVYFALGGLELSDGVIEQLDTDVALLNHQYFFSTPENKDCVIYHDGPHRIYSWRGNAHFPGADPNEPCPCSSGIIYKECCMPQEDRDNL